MRRSVLVALFVSGAAASLAAVGAEIGASAARQPRSGWVSPPAIDARDAEGRDVDLEDFRGCVVVVLFVASWTRRPSLEAMATWNRLYLELRQDGLRVVGVAEEPTTSPSEYRRFLLEAGVAFPVVRDPPGQIPIARRYRTWAMPETRTFDRYGVERDARRYAYVSPMAPRSAEEVVRQLLAARGPADATCGEP